MSLPVFQATIVNDSGDIIPSPTMTVLDEVTGLGVNVFSNRAGTVPLGTNGVFTGGTDGFCQFFAPAGNYRIKAEQAASGFEKTWDFVVLTGTAATADVQTSPTDATADRVMLNGNLGIAGYPDTLSHIDSAINGTQFSFVTGTTSGDIPFPSGSGYQFARAGTRKTQIAFEDGSSPNQSFVIRNYSGTWSAWQPVYTGANYQPEIDDGLNSPRWMKNISGGNHTLDTSYPSSQLQWAYATTGGVVTGSGATAPSGTWKQITGRTLANNEFGLYVRTA